VTIAKLYKGKDERDQSVHQVLHGAAHSVKINGRPENPDIRFPQFRVEALHIILVDTDARLLKPAVKITRTRPDLEFSGVVKLHLRAPVFQSFEKGVENEGRVGFFSFWAAIEGKDFHLFFPWVPRTSDLCLSVTQSKSMSFQKDTYPLSVHGSIPHHERKFGRSLWLPGVRPEVSKGERNFSRIHQVYISL
jgi:hypothetical protein